MSVDTQEPTRPAPARRRNPPGRRSRARQRRRRQVVFRSTATLLGILGLVIGLIALAAVLSSGGGEPAPEATLAARPVSDTQPTMLFATISETDRQADASLLVLAGYDLETADATLVLIPTTTVGDIPGHGILQVGRAYAFGGEALLDATLDNLLGIDVDHVVTISEQGWASLFTRLGGLTLDVPERLTTRDDAGNGRVRFQPGEQFLDGPRLAEYLTFAQAGETQLNRLPRAQQVLETALTAMTDTPSLIDELFADGAPMLDTAAPDEDVRMMFERLAAAHADGSLVVRTLPVTPIGSGEDDSYRIDAERVQRLVDERFVGSVPTATAGGGRTLQILNGEGRPGLGASVAARLLPSGFRVVLTGNAETFDHEITRIIVFEDTPEQLAVANEIRGLLGVGQVEISRTPQSVVDVTIVVGADFVAAHG